MRRMMFRVIATVKSRAGAGGQFSQGRQKLRDRAIDGAQRPVLHDPPMDRD